MQYLALIYTNEAEDGAMPPEQQGAVFDAYIKFTQDVKTAGAWLGGAPLQPTSTATTVRVRDGELLTTDGPFAETKEQLGGYYLLECDNLDQAIEWASKIPAARHGSIEVRPLMVFGPG
jgi:hypothetical protein